MNEPIAANPSAGHRSFRLPLTQARLLRLAAEGDPRAFEAIYQKHSQELYRYCLAILRRPEDAQDALQSTMANALRALPGESREITLRPWLFRVAHNEAITILRQRRTAVEPEETLELSAPGADTSAAERERLRTLVADLGSLPERQRSAIVLQELNGLSHEEVAATLEISPGAARQAVYEARSALFEIEEGREMECEQVRKTISARDGRMLRGRKLKAHLRECQGCSDFAAAIDQRRTDFAALFPPLPAAAAAAVLAAGTGGAVTGGGGGAGLAGAGGLGAISAKGAALVAATAVLGVGAAGYSGAVDIPLPGKSDDSSESTENSAPTSSADDRAAAAAADRSRSAGAGADGRSRERNHNNGNHNGNGNSNAGGNGGGVANSNAGGNGNGGASSYTPGTSGATPPGHGGTPPGQAAGSSSGGGGSSSSSPGQGGTVPPGQGGTAPGQVDKPPK